MPTSPKRRAGLWLVLAVILVGLIWAFHARMTFDWHSLGRQLRSVSLTYVATAVAILFFGYWLRALRWAVLLAPVRRVRAWELLGPQIIGFTAVVLIGRLADLSRPYLTARRLGLPVASQLAIYSIERAFDLGAAAILFSLTLAVAPRDLPHHAAYARAGELSLAATICIALFAVGLRFAGETIAHLVGRLLKPLSADLSERLADRVMDFREGLQAISSVREFMSAALISLVMWGGIAIAYLLCAHAFQAEPTLAHLTFTATMLLFATSLGGSLLQLPILGWFTQIAVNAAALHEFFGVPLEAATACAAVLLFVVSLDIIPVGLLLARLQGVKLRQAAHEGSELEAAASS